MDPSLIYREAAVGGASPVRLVIMLYDQAIEDLRRAISAQQRGHIEERTRQLNHALLVIGYLEATLDKVRGGQVAKNLESFYQQARSLLVEAQARQSLELMEKQVALLMLVRDAWEQTERQTSQNSGLQARDAQNNGERDAFAEWKA